MGCVNPLFLHVKVNNQTVKMELVSGARVSALLNKTFKERYSNCIFKNTSVRLHMYDGTVVIALGDSMYTYNTRTSVKRMLTNFS